MNIVHNIVHKNLKLDFWKQETFKTNGLKNELDIQSNRSLTETSEKSFNLFCTREIQVELSSFLIL